MSVSLSTDNFEPPVAVESESPIERARPLARFR
jgi:hypothetical protein